MEKSEIVQAAVEVAKEKGWDKTSVRDISKKINYSTIKVYSDFGSKDGLLQEIQKDGFRRLRQAYVRSGTNATSTAEKLVQLTLAHYRFACQHRAYYELMFQMNGSGCSMPGGDVLQTTSEPIRQLIQDIHGKVDRTLFFHWWALAHGFVVITGTQAKLPLHEATEMLGEIAQRFVTSIQS